MRPIWPFTYFVFIEKISRKIGCKSWNFRPISYLQIFLLYWKIGRKFQDLQSILLFAYFIYIQKIDCKIDRKFCDWFHIYTYIFPMHCKIGHKYWNLCSILWLILPLDIFPLPWKNRSQNHSRIPIFVTDFATDYFLQ